MLWIYLLERAAELAVVAESQIGPTARAEKKIPIGKS